MTNATSIRTPKHVSAVASDLGLCDDNFDVYGRFAAKLSLDLLQNSDAASQGKYIGVTAINPTPFGEGKTVVAIGLSMGLCRRSKRAIVTLRQPSLGPVFGIKGGGAGGGSSRVLPSEDVNLHFTGDLHAVAAANNLLAAMIDNHCARGLSPQIHSEDITWRRTLDINDKGLADIETGRNHVPMAPRRTTGFDLTAASEVMSVLALASDLHDLRRRLGRIVVTAPSASVPVTANDLGAAGAMTVLLRKAMQPNLVQTCEQTPALIHVGPFANISHGNSSVVADRIALKLADYVVTESGFGSDLGAEKLMNLKCPAAGITPSAVVPVCTVRSLKYHSGRFDVRPGRPLPEPLLQEDLSALEAGISNLIGHLENLGQYGIPVIVAINRFPMDTEAELVRVRELALAAGAKHVVRVASFSHGGEGALELADAVIEACDEPGQFRPLYSHADSFEHKLTTIPRKAYGADGVDFAEGVLERIHAWETSGFGGMPVCVAKTQYSLSHDPKLLGRPKGFRVPIQDVRLNAGAGFLLAMTEGISLMPGLPRHPAACSLDIAEDGTIVGLKTE